MAGVTASSKGMEMMDSDGGTGELANMERPKTSGGKLSQDVEAKQGPDEA